MSVLQTVKGCPLFYELYDEEIMKIVERCKVLNLQPQDPIFNEGDIGEEIFLILSGSAEVRRGDLVLAKLRKGDLFGEMVLLKDNVRNASISADNFTDILVLKYQDIFGLFKTDPKVFSILMVNLSRLLATRLKKAGDTIAEVKKENVTLKKTA